MLLAAAGVLQSLLFGSGSAALVSKNVNSKQYIVSTQMTTSNIVLISIIINERWAFVTTHTHTNNHRVFLHKNNCTTFTFSALFPLTALPDDSLTETQLSRSPLTLHTHSHTSRFRTKHKSLCFTSPPETVYRLFIYPPHHSCTIIMYCTSQLDISLHLTLIHTTCT